MAIWTVDTWKVRPESESHFLQKCGDLSPEPLTLFRDLEKPAFFWSPAKWQSRDNLDEWRTSAQYKASLFRVREYVLEYFTHVMEDVPEFPPRR